MSSSDIQHALLSPILATDPPLVGPFAVLVDPASANPFRNYAAPCRPSLPTPAELAELITFFGAHERRPRLEYVEDGRALTDALAGAGFAVDHRIPLLELDTLIRPMPVPELTVEVATADADWLGAATVMALAYGDDMAAEESAARLRRTAEKGGAVVVGRDAASGKVVGAGLHTPDADGLVEIAAVATHPDFRRRGVASNVAAALAEHAVRLGTRPFLQAESEAEAHLYERLGFIRCASMVFALGPDQDRTASPSPAPGRSA